MANSRRTIQALAWFSALTTATLLAGCGAPQKTTSAQVAQPAIPVQVQTVTLTRMPSGVTFLGSITPYIQTSLSPSTSGTLAEVNVRPGQLVQKGQLLASLGSAINVPEVNAVKQAKAALQGSQVLYNDAKRQYQQEKVQYQDALDVYHDPLPTDQQVLNAQNAVNEQLAGLNAAKVSLQKAQLQENMSLGGGNTPKDLTALQSVITADKAAVSDAQQQLTTDQNNLQVATNAYQTAEKDYGSITQAQVEQAAQAYNQILSHYQAWQSGAYPGTNPYYDTLQSDQSTYQSLSGDYSSLQQAQETYNSATAAVSRDQSSISSAQANLTQAENNLTNANPPSGSNANQMAQLTVTAAQAALNQQQIQYNASLSSLQLTEKLAADHTQAKQSLAQAVQSLNQAQESLQQAGNSVDQNQVQYQTAVTSLQTQVSEGEVIAPMNGIVQSVGAQVGQAVGPQSPLITLASTSPLMATVNVPTTSIGQIAKGTTMQIDVPSLNLQLSGSVLDIHPQLDTNTNEYPVDVLINGQPQGLLPGLQVEAQLAQATEQPVITVPADAVLSLQNGSEEVFVLSGDKVHAQIVQVGTMSSTTYQITSGLKAGEKVVVNGQNILSDGDTVRVVQTNRSKGR